MTQKVHVTKSAALLAEDKAALAELDERQREREAKLPPEDRWYGKGLIDISGLISEVIAASGSSALGQLRTMPVYHKNEPAIALIFEVHVGVPQYDDGRDVPPEVLEKLEGPESLAAIGAHIERVDRAVPIAIAVDPRDIRIRITERVASSFDHAFAKAGGDINKMVDTAYDNMKKLAGDTVSREEVDKVVRDTQVNVEAFRATKN